MKLKPIKEISINKLNSDRLKNERIYVLKEEIDKLAYRSGWETASLEERKNIRDSIKEKFDEEVELILSFDPPLIFSP